MSNGISQLLGKTLISISGDKSSQELIFETSDNKSYKMYHSQECCESVDIEDIIGDLSDLIGHPILMAEEVTNTDERKKGLEYSDEYFTWTFYKLATIKGSVTIRWYGTSNGYYSESVDFEEVT